MNKPVNARQKFLYTFHIDFASEVDDRRYTGDFTTKKLSIRDLAEVGLRKAKRSGGLYFDRDNPGKGLDEQTDEINSMLAHLEVSIVSAPQWWNLDEIADFGLVTKVYGEVLGFEHKFLSGKLRGDGPGDSSEGSGKAASSESDNNGGPSQVVEQKVQAALEP